MRTLSIYVYGMLLATLLPVGGPQADEDPLGSLKRAVDLGNRQFAESYAKLDPQEYSAIFDADGCDLQGDGAKVCGHGAILDTVRTSMAGLAGPADANAVTLQLWIAGGVGYELGRYRFAFTPKGKATVKTAGQYVATWIRQADGGWKISAILNVADQKS